MFRGKPFSRCYGDKKHYPNVPPNAPVRELSSIPLPAESAIEDARKRRVAARREIEDRRIDAEFEEIFG